MWKNMKTLTLYLNQLTKAHLTKKLFELILKNLTEFKHYFFCEKNLVLQFVMLEVQLPT